MSDPNDPILPPTSDEVQKNRHNRKGMRPKLPTLDLTATPVENNDANTSDTAVSTEDTPLSSVEQASVTATTDESAPESSIDSAPEHAETTSAPDKENSARSIEDAVTPPVQDLRSSSPQKTSRLASLFMLTAAGVIGGGLVYGLTTFIPHNDTTLAVPPAIDSALEERIAKLEQAPQPASPPQQSDQHINALIDARIVDLATSIAQHNKQLGEALGTLNQKLLASLSQIQSLEEQVKQLSTTTESAPQSAALQEEITSLEKRLDNALAESQHQLTMNRSGGLILEIERALRYGRSFDAPLQQLKAVMPQIDISNLEAYAQAGVPRMHTIAGQLLHILNSTPYEEPVPTGTPEENAGIWEQLKQSAASLVRVTPAGEINADEPRARVKAAIESEDWPTVLKEQQKLDNAAYNATRELATSLAARIEAEKALAALNTQLYSSPVIGPKPTE